MTTQEKERTVSDIKIDPNLNPELVLLDDIDAGIILATKPGTLAVWRSTGRYDLPYVKMGRRVRYQLSELYKFIESRSRTVTEYGEI